MLLVARAGTYVQLSAKMIEGVIFTNNIVAKLYFLREWQGNIILNTLEIQKLPVTNYGILIDNMLLLWITSLRHQL